MLTIRTAKEYKDFGKKVASTKIFETQKSTIDMANGLDELIDDINSDDDMEKGDGKIVIPEGIDIVERPSII